MSTHRKSFHSLLGVAASGLLLLGAGALMASNQGAISSATAASELNTPPEAFGAKSVTEAKEPGPPLPSFAVLDGEFGLQEDTSVYQGSSETSQYWSAFNRAGELCLVSVPLGTEVSGYSCSNAETFAKIALSLQSSTEGGSTSRAFFVPDGYSRAAAESGYEVIGENLLIADPTQKTRQAALVASSSASNRSLMTSGRSILIPALTPAGEVP